MNKDTSNKQSYNKFVTKERDPILHCPTSTERANYYEWCEWWANEIGKYGEEYKEQFDECMSISFNLQQELSQYSLQSELSIDKDYFLMSREQRDELANINDDEDRSHRKKEFFVEWANERNAKNLLIRESNIDNKKYREILIDKASKYKDNMMKLISNIMSTMDRNTQDLVKSFRRPFNEGERELLQLENITIESGSRGSQPKYTFQNALKSGNWFHIFEAAKSVTVVRLSDGLDGLVIRERQRDEQSKLESLQWTSGQWTNFRRLWKNQLDTCESIGCNLSDQDKMIILMSSLNTDIFYSLLSDYRSTSRRGNLPQTYMDLTDFIEDEYTCVCASKEGMEKVKKVESKRKDETIFQTEESSKTKSKSKNKTCVICNKQGHVDDGCEYRNTNFTVDQNKWYYENKIKDSSKNKIKSKTHKNKSDSDNESSVDESLKEDKDGSEDGDKKSKWNPSKGTLVTPPTNNNTNNNKDKKKSEKVNLLFNADKEEVVYNIVEDTDIVSHICCM